MSLNPIWAGMEYSKRIPFLNSGVRYALLGLILVAWSAARADELWLRDGTRMLDGRLVRMSIDGFVFQSPENPNPTVYPLDAIQKVVTLSEKRVEAEKWLALYGEPLFRIRSRLQRCDYVAALDPAEALYAKMRTRPSQAAFMVYQALVWGRVASGRREAALEPYVFALECLRTGKARREAFPGPRIPQIDERTGITTDLLPVWFDPASASEQLPLVHAAISKTAKPRAEGLRIYYATLCLAMGDKDRAMKALGEGMKQSDLVDQFAEIVKAQMEVQEGVLGPGFQELASSLNNHRHSGRPLALYWQGRGKLIDSRNEIRRTGIASLLAIPANYASEQPALSVAALELARRETFSQGDLEATQTLENEIRFRFGKEIKSLLPPDEGPTTEVVATMIDDEQLSDLIPSPDDLSEETSESGTSEADKAPRLNLESSKQSANLERMSEAAQKK